MKYKRDKYTECYKIFRKGLRRGVIERSNKCSICGSKKKIEGHHGDYNKPLDVMWLCRKCHLSLHKDMRAGTIKNEILSVRLPVGWKSALREIANSKGLSLNQMLFEDIDKNHRL